MLKLSSNRMSCLFWMQRWKGWTWYPDRLKNTTTICCRISRLCSRNLHFSFRSCYNIGRWNVRDGRELTFQQDIGSDNGSFELLWPPPAPTPINMEKKKSSKKCCRLLTGMPVCSHWVEFEPCIDYPDRTMFASSESHSPQMFCALLTFTQKHIFVSQKGCYHHVMYHYMQIIYFFS